MTSMIHHTIHIIYEYVVFHVDISSPSRRNQEINQYVTLIELINHVHCMVPSYLYKRIHL